MPQLLFFFESFLRLLKLSLHYPLILWIACSRLQIMWHQLVISRGYIKYVPCGSLVTGKASYIFILPQIFIRTWLQSANIYPDLGYGILANSPYGTSKNFLKFYPDGIMALNIVLLPPITPCNLLQLKLILDQRNGNIINHSLATSRNKNGNCSTVLS